MYAGVAVMGYTMFGESTQSQFTLNLPQDLVATKIAVWTTVIRSNMFYFHHYYMLVMITWELKIVFFKLFCRWSIHLPNILSKKIFINSFFYTVNFP